VEVVQVVLLQEELLQVELDLVEVEPVQQVQTLEHVIQAVVVAVQIVTQEEMVVLV